MISLTDIIPNYYFGFTFKWVVDFNCKYPFPWTFIVQESVGNTNKWENISEELINVFAYQERARRHYPKDPSTKFRVIFKVDDKEFISDPVAPYVNLNRREFLLAREIMRKEQLAFKTMVGVRLALYSKNQFAIPSVDAVDPISGVVTDPDSEVEYSYNGPYELFGSFSPHKRNKDMAPSGVGMMEPYLYEVRVLGFPYINNKDVIFDLNSGIGYYVDTVENVAEIRRFPVVQNLVVTAIPVGEHIYRLLK